MVANRLAAVADRPVRQHHHPERQDPRFGYLLVTVQRGWLVNDRQRTRVYRAVKFIGRWSMVDVFVDTFTAALVQLPPLVAV